MAAPSLTSLRAFALRFVVAFVAASFITGAAFAYEEWWGQRKIDQIPTAKFHKGVLKHSSPGEPGNFLIVGSDTRSFVKSKKEEENFGSSSETGGQRSDTIMVVHVDPGAKSGMVLSFPRDLYVDVYGRGPSKINAAYNAGPEALVKTIEQNFDIPIHHYLEVNFETFQEIVDAIGGVDLYFPAPARDKYTGLRIAYGGCAKLDGEQALAYARSRYYESARVDPSTGKSYWPDEVDPRADIGRIARQQYFMRTLAQTAISKVKRRPWRAINLVNNTVAELRRDPDFDLRDAKNLALTFQDVDPQRIPMETMPYIATGPEEGWRLYVDKDKAEPLLARMRTFKEHTGESAAPKEPPDVKTSDVSLRVLNGSGVAGVATQASDALGGAGFVIGSAAADADSYDYDTTEIRYSPDNKKAANLVLFYLGGRGELVESKNVSGVDVELVIGRDYAGLGQSTAASSSTTTTSTTLPPYVGDAFPGLPTAQDPNAQLPLVGCPPGS